MAHRAERINEQFKRELSEILRTEVRDPRIADVTITRVEATKDLYHARVFLTTLAAEPERESVIEGLKAAASFIRSELARRVGVRRVPELAFRWDETLDHARRIERLLAQVRPDVQAPDARDPDAAGDPHADDES
jgi:ribosome-binding factor A